MNVALGIVYGFLGVCAFFLGVSREGSCWVLWKLVTGLRSHRTAFHSSPPCHSPARDVRGLLCMCVHVLVILRGGGSHRL